MSKNSLLTRFIESLKPKPKEVPLFGGRKLTVPELRRLILDPLHEYARSKGFEEIKDDIWLRRRSDIAWDRLAFGLNEKYREEWIWSDPVVGVQCPPVHRFLQEIAEIPSRKIDGIIVAQIGYVMPKREYTKWKFPRAGSLQSTIDDMLAALEDYGLPFMEQFNDYSSMLAMRGMWGMVTMQPEEVSALQYLNGDKEAALATMLDDPELSEDNSLHESKRDVNRERNRIRKTLIDYYRHKG